MTNQRDDKFSELAFFSSVNTFLPALIYGIYRFSVRMHPKTVASNWSRIQLITRKSNMIIVIIIVTIFYA